MALESGVAVFGVGMAGGVVNEVLHWWGLRESAVLPEYAARPLYWIVTLAMVVLGGGLAWLQLGTSADALIAFEIGLAAPLILQKLVRLAPEREGAMGSGASVRGFLAG